MKRFKELAAYVREEISLDEVTFKKSPYGRTAASQQRAKDLLNPPKESSETKADEKKEVKEAVKQSTGDLKDACWTGYTAVGMKMKNGKQVPNCVPTKEEVEQLDEMPGANMDTRAVHSHLKKKGWSLSRTSGGHDVFTHPNAAHHIPVPRHRQLKAPLVKGILKSAQLSEDTKDIGEYDYEGQMARTQLQTTLRNCEDLIGMINDNDNMPEWVQSKITLAQDYITTVRDYLQSKEELGEEVEQLEEGRPSQRHPLEGHEYHKKSNAELEYIAKDAHKAAEAMKSHNTTAENKYRDQANDSATVRYYRQKNGMQPWYKKKYGHVNEEVVDEEVKDEYARKVDKYLKKKHGKDDSQKKLPQGASFADARRKARLASNGRMDEAVTYEPRPGARPQASGHTIVGHSWHSDDTKHANIMKHGETGKYFAAGGSSSHPVKSTTFHDTPEDAVKSKKSYGKEEIGQATNSNEDPNKGRFMSGPAKKVMKPAPVVTSEQSSSDIGEPQREIPLDTAKTDHTTAMKIAKSAARRQAGIKEDIEADNSLGKNDTLAKQSLSRTAGITKDLALNGKNKENVKNKEKFEPEPELSSQIVKP